MNLGNIILPPTPKPTRGVTLEQYQQSVDVWAKQCEQTVRQIERFLKTNFAGGMTGQKLTKKSDADFDFTWT